MALPTWGYSTSGDVVKYIPGRNFFEEDALGRTIVTMDDLENFMYDVASDMDGQLSRLDFSLPIVAADSPSGYDILSKVHAIGTAAKAEEAWSTAKGDVSERAGLLRADYEKDLERIWNHEIDLIDIPGGPAMPDVIADSGSMDLTSTGATRDDFFSREMAW